MPTLLGLVLLLASASTPPVLEDLTLEPQEEGAVIRVGIRGAPSFTTSEEPGLFLVDFTRVEGTPEVRGDARAPGVLGVATLPRPEGLRLRVELERWAQAEPRLEEGALVIRVFRRPDAQPSDDPAEAVATAMEGLAEQVARLGKGLRDLTGSPAEEASAAPAAAATSVSAAVATPAEKEAPAEAAAPSESAKVAAPKASATTKAPPTQVASSEPEAKPAPLPASAAAESVARVTGRITAELVRLGFRPTPSGALVLVALEGEGEHRWEQRDGLVILELAGTRIRRANDRRALDTSWFQTPVGLILPVEDRAAGTTRIEIRLQKPAQVRVERSGNEITVALAEASPAGN